MRILTFHGVGGPRYPAEAFLAQAKWLARHFRIVSLDDIVAKLSDPSEPPHHEVALTFDDGLRNAATVAYPVLKELHLQATFFVCPGLVETGRWLWTHEARQRLLQLDREGLSTLAHRLRGQAFDAEGLVGRMKGLGLAARQRVEAEIRSATPGFRPTDQERRAFDLMDWDDLAGLDPSLITVGSHSTSHATLTTLDSQELQHEVSDSRRWLEQRLGRAVRLFCYPNGSADQRVIDVARRNYSAAVTAEPGFVSHRSDGYALPRIPAGSRPCLLSWRMHRPVAVPVTLGGLALLKRTREALGALIPGPTSEDEQGPIPSRTSPRTPPAG
jgi:peptidoglycan/xylan/chitin deacetylase (PgdA/CDA1 family)